MELLTEKYQTHSERKIGYESGCLEYLMLGNVRVNSLGKSWALNPFTIYANYLKKTVTATHTRYSNSNNIFIHSDEHIQRLRL